MAQVVLEHLTKTYPEKHSAGVTAVRDLDLTIADGEFMVLVGPSGCGKSTTLRMIAGLEDITSGTITIDGRVVNDALPKDRDIAMVFQNYALYPHMSVYENLAFGLKLRKTPRPEIDRRVHEAASLLGLEPLLARRPKALSGGQRQRVAVGRAIVRQPKVSLFDEPLSNLDAKMRVAMRAEIAKLHDRLRATMIYVTHDQVEAMTMGDRICVINDGRLQQVAAPLELYHRPANLFVAGFIGSPPMNFLRGTLRAEGGTTRFKTDPASDARVSLVLPGSVAERVRAQAGKPVVLGVRPENVGVASESEAGRTVEARVELVEPLGAETHVHLHVESVPLTARLAFATELRPGQRIFLEFDFERAHWFDAATEAALP